MNKNPPKVPYDEDKFGFSHSLKIIREWFATNTYPWMKRRAVNFLAPRIGFILALVIFAVHVYWAVSSDCGINFQRSGASITFIAALLFALIDWHDPKAAVLGGGPVNKIRLFSPMFLLPLLGLIGTLIWGYGDLLPYFGKNCS